MSSNSNYPDQNPNASSHQLVSPFSPSSPFASSSFLGNSNLALPSENEEKSALEQQLNSLKELLHRSQEENTRYKQRVEQLANALQERDRRISELQLVEYRLRKTDEKTQDLESQILHEQNGAKILQIEKNQLENTLAERQQHVAQLERVIQFLREKTETAKLEARQIQNEHHSSQELIVTLTQQLENTRAELLSLRELSEQEKIQNQETLEELHAIQSQWGQIQLTARGYQQKLDQSEKNVQSLQLEKEHIESVLSIKDETIRSLESTNEDLQRKLTNHNNEIDKKNFEIIQATELQEKWNDREKELSQEISSLQLSLESKDQFVAKLQLEIANLQKELQAQEFNINEGRRTIEEKELGIRTAQQHLAKRVREATMLNDKNEEQRILIADLQKNLTEAQSKISELQQTIELQLQHERRLQNQITETIKSADVQVSKWETKYFHMYDKLQDAEKRNQELLLMEEKHQQMHALISNLTSLSGHSSQAIGQSSQPLRQMIEMQKNTYSNAHATPQHHQQPELIQPQESIEIMNVNDQIFEPQKTSIRYKQTLFD